MTVHQHQNLMTVEATADLSGVASRFKAVTIGGTICSAALVRQAAGILWYGGEIGQGLSVVRQGVTKVIAGAAVSTVGFPMTVANSGFLTVATSGTPQVGKFLATAASGDLVAAEVNFASIVPAIIA